jgi:hypothetical protein
VHFKEIPMAPQFDDANGNDMECEAYNAAFHDLGLRWHWDGSTFAALQSCGAEPSERLKHYLRTQQPHLLRAYDLDFLVNAIEQRTAVQRARREPMAGMPAPRRFDWAQALGRELGA